MFFLIVRFGDNVVFKSPVNCIDDTYSTVSELAKCFGIPVDFLTCKFVNIGCGAFFADCDGDDCDECDFGGCK